MTPEKCTCGECDSAKARNNNLHDMIDQVRKNLECKRAAQIHWESMENYYDRLEKRLSRIEEKDDGL